MSTDPSHLKNYGELATLKNAIASWFHQDAYLDFDSDSAIWSDIWASLDSAARELIVSQLKALLNGSDQEVVKLWNSYAHSHSYSSPTEARSFLSAMLLHFEQSPN